MILHLSALSMFIIPFGNLIGPFVIWQIKKNELPAINTIGREAMNFQLTYTIYTVAAAIIGSVLSCLIPFLPMLLPFAALAAIVAFTVISGIRANNGEGYEVPGVIKFLK